MPFWLTCVKSARAYRLANQESKISRTDSVHQQLRKMGTTKGEGVLSLQHFPEIPNQAKSH
jgi:hypothetical protein